MRLNYFSSVAGSLFKAKVFRVKIPLAISWALTFHCNQRCLYCRIWRNQCAELDTSEILDMIDKFRQLGMRWISFTGGEPLLRDDLGEIIKFAKEKDIYVCVSSNGRLVSEKIKQLKCIDRIKLSLDGPPPINDYIRGKGSFDKVIEAIEVCQRNNINISIECVLSKYNLGSLNYVIEIASKYRLKVLFQTATKKLLWSEDLNPLSPPTDKYKIAINYLIHEKRRGAPINNSLAGLQHLYHWPEPKKINCSAGLLGFDVEPNGTILACGRIQRNLSGKSTLDIRRALNEVDPISDCTQCWRSALVEFNLMSSLNIKTIINFFKNYLS